MSALSWIEDNGLTPRRHRTVSGGLAEARTRTLIAGKYLEVAGMKPGAQYGSRILSETDRIQALRAATQLVTAARARTM